MWIRWECARRRAFRIVVVLACIASPASAYAQTDESTCYRAHSEAQELRIQGSLIESQARMLRCAVGTCPELITADCVHWLSEMEQSIPSLVIAVTDPSGSDIVEARVTDQHGKVIVEHSDGRSVPIDPGMYELHIAASGYETAVQRVAVRESEKHRIVRVTLQPVRTSGREIPITSFVLAGTGLAGWTAFAVFGLLGHSATKDLSRCHQICANEEELQDRRQRNNILANVGLGIGVLGLSSAIAAYFLTEPSAVRAAEPAHLQAALSFNGFELSWQGRF